MKFSINMSIEGAYDVPRIQSKIHEFLESLDPLVFIEGAYDVSDEEGRTLGGHVICEGITQKVPRDGRMSGDIDVY